MKILRATHLGMCFGVRDAIQTALSTARRVPLTVLGELVHNRTVLDHLTENGVRTVHDPHSIDTRTVMITANGASDRTRNELRGQGMEVLEATCPLVHVAHRAVQQLVAEGFHPVIVGKRDHVEVRGLTEDLAAFDVILTEDDVMALDPHPRFGVAAQTTQPLERVRGLVTAIQKRFPHSEVKFADTVCQPTKQRQNAARELARQCEVVLVIGGASSNNTRELVTTCREQCARVHHLQSADDIRAEWLEDVNTVGITAGTSTPDLVIDAVEARLKKLATGPAYHASAAR